MCHRQLLFDRSLIFVQFDVEVYFTISLYSKRSTSDGGNRIIYMEYGVAITAAFSQQTAGRDGTEEKNPSFNMWLAPHRQS